MKYCAKCGKELSDDDIICAGCGCPVNNSASAATMETAPVKPVRKVNKVWIIVGAVVVLLGVIAAILFMPRSLELKDIKKSNAVTAILRYGLPESVDSDEECGMYFRYDEKHNFYGITPMGFTVYVEDDVVVFFFHSEDGRNVYNKIDRYGDREDSYYVSSFHYFNYENLDITTYDYDGSYVRIEIN